MREALYIKCDIKNIPPGHVVLDVDEYDAVKKIKPALFRTKAVLINGTAGLYEVPPFNLGTEAVINLIAGYNNIRRYAVGGNCVEAVLKILGKERAEKSFELLSTMGGATFEYWTGEDFPGQRLLALRSIEMRSTPVTVNGIFDYSCLKTIMDIDPFYWEGKIVDFIADLNIGKTSGIINPAEMPKIEGIVVSLAYLLNCGVRKIRILAHNGRLKDYSLRPNLPYGPYDPEYSLRSIAPILTILLREVSALSADEDVEFVPDCLAVSSSNSRVELKENTRFYSAETSEDPVAIRDFVEKLYLANEAHIAVNDAAGALHRDDCSKAPLVERINGPKTIGLLVKKELEKQYEIASNGQESLLVIFQGEKVDDKVPVIENFIKKRIASEIAILGKISLPFLNGNDIRASRIMQLARENRINIILPEKVKVARLPDGTSEKEFIKKLKTS